MRKPSLFRVTILILVALTLGGAGWVNVQSSCTESRIFIRYGATDTALSLEWR